MLSKDKFDYGIVFSNTAFEGTWDYISPNYVYEEYNETILENLMRIQKNNIAKNIKTSAFVIFDDCLDEPGQFNSIPLKKLSTQLRHYNISLILSTQYPHMIPPRLRSNAMVSIFFNIGQGIREMESIYNCYGQRFKNFQEFKEYYYANTDNYKFIIYSKNEDKYITYRCPETIPKFKFKYSKYK